jgi:hypothetical protein
MWILNLGYLMLFSIMMCVCNLDAYFNGYLKIIFYNVSGGDLGIDGLF